jgi:EAL domain-containing protein (putative c-di-GMP-specific phosphodiesterase class I)
VQFIEKWKKRGINLIIKEYGTNKAKNKRWVQVLLEPNIDKIQAELLANIISKEENLADVIVELYSSEEKTV